MKCDVETVGDVTIVRPIGRLDAITSPEFGKVMTELAGVEAPRLVIDFTQAPFVSSAGLRVIVTAAKKTMGRGKLVLCGIAPLVKQVFDLAGLDRIMPIVASCDDAVGVARA